MNPITLCSAVSACLWTAGAAVSVPHIWAVVLYSFAAIIMVIITAMQGEV